MLRLKRRWEETLLTPATLPRPRGRRHLNAVWCLPLKNKAAWRRPTALATCASVNALLSVRRNACTPVFQLRFSVYLFPATPRKKRADNHGTEVRTGSVWDWTFVHGCPPASANTLDSVAWNEETGEGCNGGGAGVCEWVWKGLSWGVAVFKILATYLPNFFLTARAVPLCCSVFVSTSPISFWSSVSSKFQHLEALRVAVGL